MSGPDDEGAQATRDGYDLWAADYDALDNPLIAMTRLALAAWRPSGKRVLEIGCGTGRNAAFFLAHGCEAYVGVDLSEGMLAEARRKVVDPRAHFVQHDGGDGGAALEGLGPFDGVFMSLVLEHVADLAPIVATATRVTAPGAWLHALELHPELWAEGARAHFKKGGVEVQLPSYAHDVADFRRALDGAWELVRTSAWYADASASTKLVRHRGKAVLLEVAARRA